jgi:hypothetical protein
MEQHPSTELQSITSTTAWHCCQQATVSHGVAGIYWQEDVIWYYRWKNFLRKRDRWEGYKHREPFVPVIMHTLYLYRCSYMHHVLLLLNVCIILKQSVEENICTQRLPDLGMDNLMSDHTAKSLVLCILKKVCVCCASTEMNCHEFS